MKRKVNSESDFNENIMKNSIKNVLHIIKNSQYKRYLMGKVQGLSMIPFFKPGDNTVIKIMLRQMDLI